jgi:ribose 5-phosphate isomerase B
MIIYTGADHGGFGLKSVLIPLLQSKGYEVVDCGTDTLDPADDYPIYAQKVAQAMGEKNGSFGLLLCRSGAGMAIAANRFPGIRAVECRDSAEAQQAREHDDANVLVLGADERSQEEAVQIAEVFFQTAFSNEKRHERRVQEIDAV